MSNSPRARRILIADDEESVQERFRLWIADVFSHAGKLRYEVHVATDKESTLEHISGALAEGRPYDVILLDLWHKDTEEWFGLDVIRWLKQQEMSEVLRKTVAVSGFLTRQGDSVRGPKGELSPPEDADELLHESGLFDIFVKSVNPSSVKCLVEHLCGLEPHPALRSELDLEASRLGATGEFRAIVGEAPSLRRALEMALLLAREVKSANAEPGSFPPSVLLVGESGTGKELFAQAIHKLSGRTGNFVPVNCAAIPNDLLESLLGGHEEGAFTGAIGRHDGFLQSADRGTLFLDEVGEMPLEQQAKLLRTVDSGRVRAQRVGSTTEEELDVLLLAATNRELTREVRGDRFREDLYYRLSRSVIRLPTLVQRFRERPREIDEVVRHILLSRHGLQIRFPLTLGAHRIIAETPWPGNFRRLERVVDTVIRRRSEEGANEQLTAAEVLDTLRALPRDERDALLTSSRNLQDVGRPQRDPIKEILDTAVKEYGKRWEVIKNYVVVQLFHEMAGRCNTQGEAGLEFGFGADAESAAANFYSRFRRARLTLRKAIEKQVS